MEQIVAEEIKMMKNKIIELERKLSEKAEEISKQAKQISSREAIIANLHSERIIDRANVQSCKQLSREKDGQIAVLDRKVTSQAAMIKERDEKIADLVHDIERYVDRITNLGEDIKGMQDNIARQAEMLREKDEKITDQAEKIAEQAVEIYDAKNQYGEAVMRSVEFLAHSGGHHEHGRVRVVYSSIDMEMFKAYLNASCDKTTTLYRGYTVEHLLMDYKDLTVDYLLRLRMDDMSLPEYIYLRTPYSYVIDRMANDEYYMKRPLFYAGLISNEEVIEKVFSAKHKASGLLSLIGTHNPRYQMIYKCCIKNADELRLAPTHPPGFVSSTDEDGERRVPFDVGAGSPRYTVG